MASPTWRWWRCRSWPPSRSPGPSAAREPDSRCCRSRSSPSPAAVPGALTGQAAALALSALACVALGTLVAALVPPRWLRLAIYAMAVVDTCLVAADLLQNPNQVLNAAAPAAGLPQLQFAHFGSAVIGFGDLFVAAVLGALLAGDRPLQLRDRRARRRAWRWPSTSSSSSCRSCRPRFRSLPVAVRSCAMPSRSGIRLLAALALAVLAPLLPERVERSRQHDRLPGSRREPRDTSARDGQAGPGTPSGD